jgi:hypothetical protein
MTNILQFPITPESCTGSTMRGLSVQDLHARAWSNYYSDERRKGASPELAFCRASAFVADLERMEIVARTMAED